MTDLNILRSLLSDGYEYFSSLEDDDVLTKALEILPNLSILPVEPSHECWERSREVDDILSLFSGLNERHNGYLTAVYLIGPPGSGKTQLARQFGKKFRESGGNQQDRSVVLTINVESVKSLLKSTKELLYQLRLVKEDNITKGDEDEVARKYMEELRELLKMYPGKWLFILDNMFDTKRLNDVLPKIGCDNWGNGQLIVTSQNADLPLACNKYSKMYSLREGLEENDAINALKVISGLETDNYAVDLAKELEFFPLSLASAATYVTQMIEDRPDSNFSWKRYLVEYRKHKGDLTSRTLEASDAYPHSSMDVAARLATKCIAKNRDVLRHAFDFLSYCTINPVPLVMVSNFVKALISCGTIRDKIKAEISRCSLLLRVKSSFQGVEMIKFHQVMGRAFKFEREERTSKLDKDQMRNNYVTLLRSLQETLDEEIPDYERRSVAMKVLASPHLESIVKFGQDQQWSKCAEFVVILAALADCLYHVPGVTEVKRIKYSEDAYEIAKELPEPLKSLKYCKVLKTLGFYYRENNSLEKSVLVLKEGLRLTDGESGDEWIRMKSSLLNVLSWTYKLQMKLDLAEEKLKESINLARISFGDDHQEIVERLCNFAIIYREKQDISKAKEKVDEARRMAETYTNEWHLTRAQAANFSAKIYLRYAEITESSEKKKELLEDSLKLHNEALKIYEDVLGKNHIYVAGVCMTYAIVHKELNNLDRALELTEQAEKIYKDVEHTQLSAALRYKTEVLLALRNASEAEKAIKASIELSEVYLQQNRCQESRTIIKEVLARWKSGVLSPEHSLEKRAKEIEQECDRIQRRRKVDEVEGDVDPCEGPSEKILKISSP